MTKIIITNSKGNLAKVDITFGKDIITITKFGIPKIDLNPEKG